MSSPTPTDSPICQCCSNPLPRFAHDGLCPACELRGALETGDDPLENDGEDARGSLGGYELLGEVGRGGMGVVWKARQPGLGRTVAVKILPGGDFASVASRTRFIREAEAAASLRHPGLVAVHDCGEHEGTLWYSMDYIEGQSLSALIQSQQRLTARHAARLMEKVSRAGAHAHAQGVWHRDLKPANILIDAHGEPHITDFGLAHTEENAPLRSQEMSRAPRIICRLSASWRTRQTPWAIPLAMSIPLEPRFIIWSLASRLSVAPTSPPSWQNSARSPPRPRER